MIEKYPDGGLTVFEGQGNKFCRNPDGKSTIWCCYGTDLANRCDEWSYCLPPEQREYNDNEGLIYDSSRPSLESLQSNYDAYYNDWNKTGLLGLRMQVTFKSRVNCTAIGLHFWDQEAMLTYFEMKSLINGGWPHLGTQIDYIRTCFYSPSPDIIASELMRTAFDEFAYNTKGYDLNAQRF